MDVRLPDGTIVKNVPEGTTKAELMAKVSRSKRKEQQPAQATTTQEPLSALSRFAYGMQEPISGAAQLLYEAMPAPVQQFGTAVDRGLHDLTGGLLGRQKPYSESLADIEAAYQSRAPEGMDLARLGGNIVTGVVATRGMGAPQSAGQAMGQGAVIGGGLSGVAPVYGGDFAEEKAKQVGLGTALGTVLGPAAYGVGRVISPAASRNEDIKTMAEMGVAPTIGGTLGGAASRFEQMSQSIPLLGDAIRAARVGNRDQFNRQILNKAVDPLGKTVKDIGEEGVAEIQAISSQAYADAAKMLPGFRLDRQAFEEINSLFGGAKWMRGDEQRAFNRWASDVFKERFRKGGITAEGYKRLDSEIGEMATKKAGTEFGTMLSELDQILKRLAQRVNPEYREAISKADEVFRNRVVIEKAANSASGSGGVFTPKQLITAGKTTDRSARQWKSAGGDRPFRNEAGAASRTIGDDYPESGTAGRAITGTALTGGAAVDPLTTAAIGGGLWGAGKALYSPQVQNVLRQAATLRPEQAKLIADRVARMGPLMAPGLLSTF